jgi:macrophage erythroblast attacher
LFHIPTLADVKYEQWSKTRLDRLLVDYMLRNGYGQSAKELASEKKIEALVDVDEFEALARIEHSLRSEYRVDLALAWCGENKLNLKKMNVRDQHYYASPDRSNLSRATLSMSYDYNNISNW